MKIAIISDSHDNILNIDEMLKIIKAEGVENIIHCGDISAPSVVEYLSKNFSGNIYITQGNVDGNHAEKIKKDNLKNITFFSDTGEAELDSKKIAFVHYPNKAKELTKSGKYDLVFYGHNHTPWEESIGNTKLANPGTLAGLFAKPTFAFYDTESDKLELKLLY